MGYVTLLASVEVDIFQIECMNMAGEVAEESEEDIDDEISATATNHKHADGWDWQTQLAHVV
jgi:hypothetical protein